MKPDHLVREYWKRMNDNDFAGAAELFADDYTLEWPQSDEVVIGRERFIQINREYPAQGRWTFTVNRLVREENGNTPEDPAVVVSDVTVTDGATVSRAVTFSYVAGGLILRQTEYWPEEYPAPENRAHLTSKFHH